jgi:hypothetical protein
MRSGCIGNTAKSFDCHARAGLTHAETILLIIVVLVVFLLLCPLFNVHILHDRTLARRMICGTNLAGIGKAMLLYANDYDDELPRAGGRNSSWSPVVWNAATRQLAYSLDVNDSGGRTSVSSSFYLLVKYAGLTPESFICPADKGAQKWSGENVKGATAKFADCWDFGPNPQTHCSYAYHWPFGPTPLTTSTEPGFAIAADRNPWMPAPRFNAKPFPRSPDGQYTFQGNSGNTMDQLYGNTTVHEERGQNVMFLDTHVTFEQRPYCGLGDDNIYTRSTLADKGDPLGVPPVFSPPMPPNPRDSVLIHDPPTWPASVGQR